MSDDQVVYSAWTPTTCSSMRRGRAAAPVLANFTLVDRGAEGTVSSALFTGSVTSDGNSPDLIVQFDANGDGVADGTAAVGADGSFVYQPSALPLGYQVMRARGGGMGAVGGRFWTTAGGWQYMIGAAIDFLGGPPPAVSMVPQITGLSAASNEGVDANGNSVPVAVTVSGTVVTGMGLRSR